MNFKSQGFAGMFAKQLLEGTNPNANLFGKGNPNGTPHGTKDNSGIGGDHAVKPQPNPLGAGSPNANKGDPLPDTRATQTPDPNGKGSPNGQPHGVKPHDTPDGKPASTTQAGASAEDNNDTYAKKLGKVNESLAGVDFAGHGVTISEMSISFGADGSAIVEVAYKEKDCADDKKDKLDDFAAKFGKK